MISGNSPKAALPIKPKDNVSAKYLKMSAVIVAPILVHIFNCSIKSNDFPTLFKTAKIVPIYKKGDK